MTIGMLRQSEAVKLKSTDVWVESVNGEDVLFVFIEQSKTDQLRIGHTIVLSAAEDSMTCTLAWFARVSRFRVPGAGYFFHTAQGTKLSEKTPNGRLKVWFERLNLPGKDYGSHSCRRGGATAAVKAGVELRLVKRHGNWRSSCVDVYITDDIDAMLRVSQGILAS